MKRFLSAILLVVAGAGCSLNSPYESNKSGMDMTKPCSCPGMEGCSTGKDGTPCCTPDACLCKQISAK